MFCKIVTHSVSTQSELGYFECPAVIQQTVATFQVPVNLEWTFVYVVHALLTSTSEKPGSVRYHLRITLCSSGFVDVTQTRSFADKFIAYKCRNYELMPKL